MARYTSLGGQFKHLPISFGCHFTIQTLLIYHVQNLSPYIALQMIMEEVQQLLKSGML